MKMYFNKHEFLEALKLNDTNPYLAEKKYEEYFMKYPMDYNSYPYYISLLIYIGKFKKAENLLNYIKKQMIRDDKYCNNAFKVDYFNYGEFVCRMKLLFYTGRYQEAIEYYCNNASKINASDLTDNFGAVLLYCHKKLGQNNLKQDMGNNSYLFKQILDYSENNFRNHIKKHLISESEEENDCMFKEDFPIDTIIDEIKKYIPSNKALYNGFLNKLYYFKYDNCGRCDNKITNYFKVVTFSDNNFITMCPTKEGENLPYTDLNYIMEKNESKVKKISQIDKFNKRFKR